MTITDIDISILLFIQEHFRNVALTPIFKAVSFLGNTGWFWILVCAGLLIYQRTRKTGITSSISLASTFLITTTIKHIIVRTRPYDAFLAIQRLIPAVHDPSFPSGHTSASFAVALILLYTCPKRIGIPAVILAGLIAFSRLYLGVHYPSDVLCAFLIALLVSLLVRKFLIKPENDKIRSLEYLRL